MTIEEMQELQRRVETMLRSAGAADVEALPFEPGEPAAVGFYDTETEHLIVLEIQLA